MDGIDMLVPDKKAEALADASNALMHQILDDLGPNGSLDLIKEVLLEKVGGLTLKYPDPTGALEKMAVEELAVIECYNAMNDLLSTLGAIAGDAAKVEPAPTEGPAEPSEAEVDAVRARLDDAFTEALMAEEAMDRAAIDLTVHLVEDFGGATWPDIGILLQDHYRSRIRSAGLLPPKKRLDVQVAEHALALFEDGSLSEMLYEVADNEVMGAGALWTFHDFDLAGKGAEAGCGCASNLTSGVADQLAQAADDLCDAVYGSRGPQAAPVNGPMGASAGDSGSMGAHDGIDAEALLNKVFEHAAFIGRVGEQFQAVRGVLKSANTTEGKVMAEAMVDMAVSSLATKLKKLAKHIG